MIKVRDRGDLGALLQDCALTACDLEKKEPAQGVDVGLICDSIARLIQRPRITKKNGGKINSPLDYLDI